MPAGKITLTATGDIGPGQQVTAQVIQNVSKMAFDFVAGTVSVEADNYNGIFQYSNLSGVTFTPASRTVSFTDA